MSLPFDAAGTGMPVVLLHAGVADRRMWAAQLPVLAERYRVWSLDFRGHGDSTLPTDGRGLQWEGFGDDVLAVVDALELDEAVSMNGGSTG